VKKLNVAEQVWQDMRKKYVDDWEPLESDIDWLVNTVESMKIGAKWVLPAAGATFEKVGHDHLRLESIVTNDMLASMIAIEKTKKAGDKAALRIDIEKAADYILFHPTLRSPDLKR
jgi:hypothetical protein